MPPTLLEARHCKRGHRCASAGRRNWRKGKGIFGKSNDNGKHDLCYAPAQEDPIKLKEAFDEKALAKELAQLKKEARENPLREIDLEMLDAALVSFSSSL